MSGSNPLTIPRDPTVLVNPLAAMNAGIEGAGQVYDLRQKQADEAAGQAFLNSIDPATGQPNQSLLLQNLRRNPATAMSAQVSAQRGLTLDTGTYDLHNKRVNGAMGAMGQLIADNPDGVPADALRAAIEQQHALGNITDQEAQAARSQVSDNPRANTQFVIRGMGHGLSAQQALDAAKPSPSVQNIGGQVVTLQPSAQGASSPTPSLSQGTGGVGTTLSPGEQAQYQQWLQGEVEIPDPNNPGGTQKSTRLQMFQRMGVDPKLFYPGSGGGGGAPPASPPASPNASPNVRTPPASPNASPDAGRPLPAPSQADIETQKAGAGMGVALTQRAGQVPDNQANLGNMLADAAKLDSMGAGTAREAYLNSFFQKWSGSGLLGNATREQIAAAESFNKIGNIMASNQMAALGASDARQQLAIGANPHLDLSKLGNEQIIHMLQGNEDAIAAKSRAWEDWKLTHGSGSYAQFQNELNKNFDLRVFQQRYMGDGKNGTPDEIGAMRAQMEKQGTAKEFVRKILYARAQHWIP